MSLQVYYDRKTNLDDVKDTKNLVKDWLIHITQRFLKTNHKFHHYLDDTRALDS